MAPVPAAVGRLPHGGLISHTTFDAIDAYAQSVFWGQVLGSVQDPNEPDCPGDDECMIFSPDGSQRMLFIEVPEVKQVKNRLHLDLVPASGTRDEELARLLGLGASTVDDLRRPDGPGWVVLADPEGNEFCILRARAPDRRVRRVRRVRQPRPQGRTRTGLSERGPTILRAGQACGVSTVGLPAPANSTDSIRAEASLWSRSTRWV